MFSRHKPGLQHLAFMVSTRSVVREVHDWVKGTHGEILHEPQEFPQYPPPYYATFWLDPFGSCWRPCATTTATEPPALHTRR